MARLPRLALAGHAHLVLLPALPARPAFVDETDRETFLAVLREAATGHGVALYAWSLDAAEVRLLVTPGESAALGRFVQAVGRRYVSAYNRRHGGAGTLWSGRYRAGVVQPGAWRLAALLWVDGNGAHTSAPQRCGAPRDPQLADPPELWALGNTPFEREAAYRRRLDDGLAPAQARSLRAAASGGWVVGEPAFVAAIEPPGGRPLRPRSPGRPASL